MEEYAISLVTTGGGGGGLDSSLKATSEDVDNKVADKWIDAQLLSAKLTGIAHTAITNIDLKATSNKNEYVIEITWTGKDGNTQKTTDPTPIRIVTNYEIAEDALADNAGEEITNQDINDFMTANPSITRGYVRLTRGRRVSLYWIDEDNAIPPVLLYYSTINLSENEVIDKDSVLKGSVSGKDLHAAIDTHRQKKTKEDIKLGKDSTTVASYTPEDIHDAIVDIALSPSYNGLLRNGSLIEGLANFNVQTDNGKTELSQNHILKFNSVETLKRTGYIAQLAEEFIPINPSLKYRADMDILFDDATYSDGDHPIYFYFDFADADKKRISIQHITYLYKTGVGSVMTRTADVSAGDTSIFVDKNALFPMSLNFRRDLKLGPYKNTKGGIYPFTDRDNYSRVFAFSNTEFPSTELIIDEPNSTENEIKLLRPITQEEADRINAYPSFCQSNSGGSYAYIDPYLHEETTLPKASTGDYDKFSYLSTRDKDKVYHVAFELYGKGVWEGGKIPSFAAYMRLGALLNYGSSTKITYLANMSVKQVPVYVRLPTVIEDVTKPITNGIMPYFITKKFDVEIDKITLTFFDRRFGANHIRSRIIELTEEEFFMGVGALNWGDSNTGQYFTYRISADNTTYDFYFKFRVSPNGIAFGVEDLHAGLYNSYGAYKVEITYKG